jgi:V/A-type H+-transporting ATPase subunit D
MIHPTRTNLLLLKEKSRSVHNVIGILKARRQALIRELLAATAPFLESRDSIRAAYGRAVIELALTLGIEGEEFLDSIEAVSKRDLGIVISERNLMGLRYREVSVRESPVRRPDGRGYDYLGTTSHLEEALQLFEKILEEMLEVAVFENKVKRLGEEIVRVSQRIRVLEERLVPDLRRKVRTITQFLGERERESAYRLKRFSTSRGGD